MGKRKKLRNVTSKFVLLYFRRFIVPYIKLQISFRAAMPPKKKPKTRSSWSCYGAPVKLPDHGLLYTLKEVLSAVAFEAEKSNTPPMAHYGTVEKEIRLKFKQGNPKLPLISDDSAIKKMDREMEAVKLLDANKLTVKKKSNLLSRLDKIFDLVTCQCKIVDCNEDHECSGAHVLCHCPKENPRIPDIEAAWIRDQRMRDGSNKPKFMMKGIDWETGETQQKQVDRIQAKKKAEKNREAKV